MSDLTVDLYDPGSLRRALDAAPEEPAVLTDDHRRALAARFRAVPDLAHRRLDAWTVETAGRDASAFTWTPAAARRTLATAALRRVTASRGLALTSAVRDALEERVARGRTGQRASGSLDAWLERVGEPVRGLVVAEAVGWAAATLEAAHGVTAPWTVPPSDCYYDVAAARTTLRGRRDLEFRVGERRVVVRLRAGSPRASAGAGLRADLVVCALADPAGVAPARLVGLWPEAGVVLGVDGSMEDLRAGARDLVRAAVAARRRRLVLAA
ncbi:MAG: hypothetical protein ACHQFZ_05005 [Acidimicrobiales bacterium]